MDDPTGGSMTLDTLIALVDGSHYSKSVCHYAAWIARRTGARVKIYHVIGRREGVGQQDLSGTIQLGARSHLLRELSELDARRAKLAQAQGRAILEDAKAALARGAHLALACRAMVALASEEKISAEALRKIDLVTVAGTDIFLYTLNTLGVIYSINFTLELIDFK